MSRNVVWGCAVVATLVLLGCSGTGQDEADSPGSAEATSDEATSEEGVAAAALTLAGDVGCGHCEFEVTGECAPAFKTAEGEIYVIDGVEEGSDLWEARHGGGRVEVVGVVSMVEGVQHMMPESYQMQ